MPLPVNSDGRSRASSAASGRSRTSTTDRVRAISGECRARVATFSAPTEEKASLTDDVDAPASPDLQNADSRTTFQVEAESIEVSGLSASTVASPRVGDTAPTTEQIVFEVDSGAKSKIFAVLLFCCFCDASGIGFIMPVVSYMTGNQDGSPFIRPNFTAPEGLAVDFKCTSLLTPGCVSFAKDGAFPRLGLPYGLSNNFMMFSYIFGQALSNLVWPRLSDTWCAATIA